MQLLGFQLATITIEQKIGSNLGLICWCICLLRQKSDRYFSPTQGWISADSCSHWQSGSDHATALDSSSSACVCGVIPAVAAIDLNR